MQEEDRHESDELTVSDSSPNSSRDNEEGMSLESRKGVEGGQLLPKDL